MTLAGTGLETMTGGRVFRASKYLKDTDENFFLTYGDGVSDVDIAAVYQHHLSSDKLLTLTAVQPEARFGIMNLSGNNVTGFAEKQAQADDYINGGFMVIRKEFIRRYLNGNEDQFLEREPMTRCAADGGMQVFKHDGFWQCMDNQREYNMLNEMWEKGEAPWTKYWK